MLPKRIQRSRRVPYPLNAPQPIYVGRPSKYGNPLLLKKGIIYINISHRIHARDKWVKLTTGDAAKMVKIYRVLLTSEFTPGEYHISVDMLIEMQHWANYYRALDITALRGHNLACWCPLGQPCHADVLLELANKPTE